MTLGFRVQGSGFKGIIYWGYTGDDGKETRETTM